MSAISERKVVLITGGNAGIGLWIVRRLLQNDPQLRICLACRSKARAESARSGLLKAYPQAKIGIVIMNVASVRSVYKAAEEIRKRYNHIDYVFLNAGVMPATAVNWESFWQQLFSSRCIHMFATGEGLLKQTDELTVDGLPKTFSTNVFGHFVLIKEIEEILGGGEHYTQIIWTSSANASPTAFNFRNIEHRDGPEPYASSKYAVDCLSVALNEKLNKKGVYSHTTCPGLVMTNLTYGILPIWLWRIFLPILWLLRLFTPAMSVEPENGAEALVWLTEQKKPETLDPRSKFHSCTSPFGKRYTQTRKMNIEPELPQIVYDKLAVLEHDFKLKCYGSNGNGVS